jgi:molybdopterin synthase sulfur carrier subunit
MEWQLFADLAETTGERHVTVSVEPGSTVGDALDALLDAHPALEQRVLAADGDLHGHVTLLRNGTNVCTSEDGLDTTTEKDDELALLPPVSGG